MNTQRQRMIWFEITKRRKIAEQLEREKATTPPHQANQTNALEKTKIKNDEIKEL